MTRENWYLGFPTRSDTNQPVQSQKKARSLKFRIYKEEEFYYPCSKNKGADQLRSFAKAKLWFSHGAAQVITVNDISLRQQTI